MPQLFAGIIHKDKDSDYGVCFPDFPGCITAGSTMQEAFLMAQEALQAHIDIMHEYGDPLPSEPMTLDEAQTHEFAENAVGYFMVSAHLPTKPKRINIMMDEGLIRAIDAVSNNRSAFLAQAAKERLQHL